MHCLLMAWLRLFVLATKGWTSKDNTFMAFLITSWDGCFAVLHRRRVIISSVLFHYTTQSTAFSPTPQTVILDSCHSSGMAREAGTPRTARSCSRSIPPELDSPLCNDTSQTQQSWSQSSATHVMLSACRQGEAAREIPGVDNIVHGIFTSSLVTRLRSVPLENTTYTELLGGLAILPGQTPSCNGLNRNRLVFSGDCAVNGSRSLLLRSCGDSRDGMLSFRVDIGSVEGVVVGTEFAVCLNDEIGTHDPMLRFIASTVRIHETIVIAQGSNTVPEGARAVVTHWNNTGMILRVHLKSGFPYTAVLFPTGFAAQPGRRRYVEAPLQTADVVLRSDGDDLCIKRTTSIMEVDGVHDMHISLKENPTNLPNILDAIVHFDYFLQRENDVPQLRIRGHELEMYRLVGEMPCRKPDDESANMIHREASRYVARFISKHGVKYGFKIRNNGDEDVYPYLLYFDPEDYTIHPLYTHVNGTPPLAKKGGTLVIGMGGESAFEFTLPESQMSSSGFLKLFVATEPLNIERIAQDYPLDSKFPGLERLKLKLESMPARWDALVAILTMTSNK
ncbi:hypothetical protein FB451DRAFT_733280 [Mycena latifolia]|nr:hypothetical protein FB451DRAFT_733280 [Mycena latifolia]